ncbi:MAG: 4a-hydroxytetrahydrobiopterin dehydratase [Patescibacteria group bacterium]
MNLTKKHCVPCEGGIDPYTKREAEEYLKAVEGWYLVDEQPMKLQRKFTFKDFKEAMVFVNKVADLANSEDHHPNINIHSYKKVDITLYTHAIEGLSENDYIIAAKINQLM